MRIRIALGTAVAVIVLPVLLFALYSIPAASARVTRHEAISQHRAVKINSKLMSYAQAQQVAKLATYSNAVAAQQEATYLKDVAFLTYLKDVNFMKAVALQRQQAAQQAAAQQAAAHAGSRSRCASGARSGSGSGSGRRLVGCHQHEHRRLGLHPTARVGWQLRRRRRRCVPVRERDVDLADGLALAGPGLPRIGPGRRGAQAVLRARLGAVDHPLRLRAVRTEPSMGPGVPGPRIEDDTQ